MNDHDLLIEISTVQKSLVDDFRSYRKENYAAMSDIHKKIDDLEREKASQTSFEKHVESSDERQRRIEKTVYTATGIIGALQFLAPYLLNKTGALWNFIIPCENQ